MKHLYLIALSSFFSMAISAQNLSDKEIIDYFNHIALNQEFEDKNVKVKKWARDINIFCEGKWNPALKKELQTIIKDLSALIGKVKINVVQSKTKSNYRIFIGSPDDYVAKVEPKAKEKVLNNFGLFWIYWDQNNQILRGSMYVDPARANTLAWQKHLLREELTQSLGLMNDSLKYKDSIFYEKYSHVTKFSKIDTILIKLLYSKFIRPNMTKRSVERIIELQSLINKTKKELKY